MRQHCFQLQHDTTTAAVYSKHSEARDTQEVTTRKDATLLAQLRSGHSFLFQAYKHLLDESTDPTCPRCREAPHTLEHKLDCPGTVQARMEIIGTTQQLPLSTLTAFPGKSVALAGAGRTL